MLDHPVTFQEWDANGDSYPTKGTLYNWTRPGATHDEMLRAGVIVRIGGRWLFNPENWRKYCSRQAA